MKKKEKSINEDELQAEDQSENDWDEESAELAHKGKDVGEGEDDLEPLSIDDELSSLQSELDDIRTKAEEYLDGWQRARAEFANYKKRVQKEREQSRSFIKAEILLKYLTVIDDFERALNDRPADDASEAWAEGIDMIYRKLKGILESEGVEEISVKGELFDPNFHEALTFEESEDHNEGEIVDVIQPGYKIGERVIRPAVVRVAK